MFAEVLVLLCALAPRARQLSQPSLPDPHTGTLETTYALFELLLPVLTSLLASLLDY